MEESELFDSILQGKREFGAKCKKFTGALTVEMLKRALEERGILVSPRDVFIRGLSIEIDLLVPKTGGNPKYGLLYEPEDVVAALEVKNLGSFGKETINRIRANFELIRQTNANIYCAYVTFTERRGYKWAITEENLGFPAYTLSWHQGIGRKYTLERTGYFAKLLDDIYGVMQADRSASFTKHGLP